MARILTYKESLYDRILHRNSDVFENTTIECAEDILTVMLEKSTEIYLYVKDIDGDVSNSIEFVQVLKDFLNKDNTKLYLMLDDPSKRKSGFYHAIKSSLLAGNNNISVKKAHHLFIREMEKNKGLRYFAVTNNGMYRNQGESDIYKAFCNFDDPIQSGVLKSLFFTFWDFSEDVFF